MSEPDRPVLEAVGEVKRPGWIQVGRYGRETWLQISNIEAVTFDGYGTDIVMLNGKKYDGFGNVENTLARIQACLSPTPIVNAGEER